MNARSLTLRALAVSTATLIASLAWLSTAAAQTATRPMTFLDVRLMRSVNSPTPSPDGQWLFANIYDPGMTVAITGPWQSGRL